MARDRLEALCRAHAARQVNRLRAQGFEPDFDDALQGARYGAWRARESFDPGRGCQLTTWAFPWVRRYAQLEAYKSAGLTTRGDGSRNMPQETPGARWSHEDPIPRVIDRVAVRQAVRGLPGRDRILLWLWYWEELEQREVAAHLGVSRARARYLHARALDRLRAALEV